MWHQAYARRAAVAPTMCAVAALWLGGCDQTSRPPPPPPQPLHAAATQPGDVPCPYCTMRRYVWDDTTRHGRVVHHDVTGMECPYCQSQTAGVWAVIGPSHTCPDCPQGVAKCPMCRPTSTAP